MRIFFRRIIGIILIATVLATSVTTYAVDSNEVDVVLSLDILSEDVEEKSDYNEPDGEEIEITVSDKTASEIIDVEESEIDPEEVENRENEPEIDEENIITDEDLMIGDELSDDEDLGDAILIEEINDEELLGAASLGCGDNLTWRRDNMVLRISGTGEMWDFQYGECGPWGKNTFSVLIIEPGVTSIGDYAFCGCTKLTDIQFPSSVSSIGRSAFSNCEGLTEISLPEGLESIGDLAFSSCTGLTEISFPKGLTSIGNEAFSYCSGLTEISLPEGLESIGNEAFYHCEGLTEISLPEGLESIGDLAFGSCTGLTEISLPEGLKILGCSVFYHLTDLTEISLPEGLESIGGLAFEGCTGLTEIELPSSLTSIGVDAFKGCTGLTKISLSEGLPSTEASIGNNAFEGCTGLTEISLPESLTSIGNSAFENCSNLERIYFPERLISTGASIGNKAFYHCEGLTEISFPEGLTSIGNEAFYHCEGLTEIELPSSLTSIGGLAFDGCTGLTEISLPEGLESIGYQAFSYCTGLTEISLPEGLESIGKSAFEGCTGLTEIELPSSLTSIGNEAFEGCTGLTRISFTKGVPSTGISIGQKAFYRCGGLSEIELPSSLTSIGNSAFENCSNLERIYFPERLISTGASIGSKAFYHCEGLTEISFPEGLTSIGNEAFFHCSGLTEIELPSSLTGTGSLPSIGNYAFFHCSGLTEISFPEKVTSSWASIGNNAFSYCSGLTGITLPEGFNRIGDNAFSYCSGLTGITLPEGLKSIGAHAFEGCTSLTEISLPESLKSIGAHAFSECRNLTLTENSLPEGLTNIGDYAFEKCYSLTGISLPKSLTSIGDFAFEYCSSLTEISLPEGLESISKYAFYGCEGLTEIELPSSLTSIGENAFNGCSSLTEISLPEGLESIGKRAFCCNTKLTKIELPVGITSIGDHAFYKCPSLSDVYYASTKSSWDRIQIGEYNENLLNANIHYGASGDCNDDISWSIDDRGVLTITGMGNMPDYSSAPWYSLRNSITEIVIDEGITSVGAYAFSECVEATSLTIPYTIESIGANAFNLCDSISDVYYSGTTESWNSISLNVYYAVRDASLHYMISVVFDANGGTVEVNGKMVVAGQQYGELPIPVAMTGFTFDGWYLSKEGNDKVTEDTVVNSEQTHTLYARWVATKVKVYYDANGGEIDNISDEVEYGSAFGEMPIPTLTGYHFDGWFTELKNGEKISNESIVNQIEDYKLYAYWTANLYMVSFDANDGTVDIDTKIVTYGMAYGDLPVPERTGYTFDGWYTSKTSGTRVVASSTVTFTDTQTLYANWIANTYAVIYDGNGGVIAGDSTKNVIFGELYGELATPSKTGYYFSGWYTAVNGGTNVTAASCVSTAGDHSLYAHWDAQDYIVSFNANGGSSNTNTKTVYYGSEFGSLPIATRNGYTFDGWYTELNSGNKITATTRVQFTSDQTVYAHWIAGDYILKFDANGGTVDVGSKNVIFDKPYGELPTPERTGYSFNGWYTARIGGHEITNDTITDGSATLYAHWIADTYSVIFDPNGGTVSPAEKQITYDSSYGSLPTSTRNGYTFDGWYTELNGGNKVTATTKVQITSDQTVYAHWIARTYSLIFDANGGTIGISSKTIKYDQPYGELPNPEKTGYIFEGWYTSQTGGDKRTSASIASGAETLYAHWKAQTYLVILDPNGGNVSQRSKTVYYGSAYGTLPTPTKAGYSFLGWYTDSVSGGEILTSSTVTILTDQTLYAQWSANSYTVTFNANGGSVSISNMSVYYDSEYGSLPTATRNGYKLDGWYTDLNSGEKVINTTKVQITSAQTLYAHWIAREYILTFDANGGIVDVSTKPITYGQSYGKLPTPEKTGYSFDGWYTSKIGGNKRTDTSVTFGAETLYAHWMVESYSVKFDPNGGDVSLSTKQISFDSSYGDLPTPVFAGYHFDGWFTKAEGGTQVTSTTRIDTAGDRIIYAHWSLIHYTVRFDANGGESVTDTLSVTMEDVYGALPVISRTGYTFAGWFTGKTDGTEVTATTTLPSASDQTIHAHWTANDYVVSFDANTGSVDTESKKVTYNEVYGDLPVPERAGYSFVGWFTAAIDGNIVYAQTIVNNGSDHALYAHWKADEYVVAFDSNGGTAEEERKVTYDALYGELPRPTMIGGIFVGWFTEKEGGIEVTADTIVSVTDNQLLYAHWDLKYTVADPVFNISSGTELEKGRRVSITTETSGASIFYTLNGNDPSDIENASLYKDAIVVKENITVKAIAVKAGQKNSEVISAIYTVKDSSSDWGDVLEEDKAGFENADRIPEDLWIRGVTDTDYTGRAITFSEIRVYKGKDLLKMGTDYTVKYSNNTKPGDAKVIITGKGNYSGTIVKTFKINRLDIGFANARDITLTFNNKVQKGTTSVTYMLNGAIKTLKANTDFTFVYPKTDSKTADYDASAFKAVGNYEVQIVGKGNYTGTKSFSVKITELPLINKMTVKNVVSKVAYTGSAITQDKLEVWNGKDKLIEGTDYSVDYEDNTEIGTAYVVIAGINNYSGTVYKSFKIVGTDISKYSVAYATVNTFSGEATEPKVRVYQKTTPERELTLGTDYKVSYENNIKAGKKAAIIITGINGCTGTIRKTFTINPKDIGNFTVTVDDAVQQKGGSRPYVTVCDGTTKLVSGVDYTVAYSNNTKIHDGRSVNSPVVKVVGKGNYKGTVIRTFPITASSMANVTISASDITYQNKAGICKTTIKLVDSNGKALKAGTDYEKSVTYSYAKDVMVSQVVDARNKIYRDVIRLEGMPVDSKDIIPVGAEITAHISGKGNYPGEKEVTFRYVVADLSKAEVTIKAQKYTGKAVDLSKNDITVKVGKEILKSTDYEIVGYNKNVTRGNAEVIIRGIGNYGGIKTAKFSIVALVIIKR